MDKAVRMNAPGGVDQLEVVEWPVQTPGRGEIRIRHEAIGINFIDIYHRTGLYPLPPPAIPGVEGAGIVEAIGDGVDDLLVGQRVAYAGVPGGYASTRLLPAWRAALLPDDISSTCSAASMLRGLTTHMLLTRTYPVAAGVTILVHAAAGGLGVVLTRWAKHLGAIVIGTVGSVDKASIARGHGADHVIIGRNADLTTEVDHLTEGQGVDYTIDGIGGATLAKSLSCTKRFGTVASIGQAAGPIPPVPVEDIGPIRSLNFTRPSVMAYAAERVTYPSAMAAVLAMMEVGIVTGSGPTYRLEDAAVAQADLEAGQIVGSAVLLP